MIGSMVGMSSSFVAGLADAMVDAAVVVDPELRLLHFNRAFAKLVGLRPRDIEGKRAVCHDVLGLASCNEGCVALRALKAGRPLRVDEVATRNDDLRLNVSAVPITDAEGKLLGILETYRDVTGESRMQSRYKDLLEVERRQNELLQEQVRLRTADLQAAVGELEKKNAILEELALRDGLTGLYNHRSFQQRVREEMARAQRHGGCLSLVLADVDHFKRVNDTYGHPVGDAVLRHVAGLLSGGDPDTIPARRSDMVARYGGEEFAILLMDTPKEGAVVRAERLREVFEQADPPASLISHRVSLSFGVAAYPDDAGDASDLVLRADDALLEAKRSGRNRVVVWMPARHEQPPVLVKSYQEASVALSDSLKSDRLMSIVALRLIDLKRLERYYGTKGARTASETFSSIVKTETERVVPHGQLLPIVGAEPGRIEIFVRHPKDDARLGPRSLEKLAERIAQRVESLLRDALTPMGLGLARVVCGHATHLHTTEIPLDRQMERLRHFADSQAGITADLRRARDKLLIQRVIIDQAIDAWVQPIFDASGAIVGHEALARGLAGPTLENPVVLLDLAEDVELLTELDLCMARAALATFSRLGGTGRLFLNLLPTTITHGRFSGEDLPRLVADAGLEATRIVVELSERQSADEAQLVGALKVLRAKGFVIGLDDLGTQNANLSEIASFRPEWLKLDRLLVRGVDADDVKRDLVSAISDFAHRQGSKVIAEGIETRAELETLKGLHVDAFQGFLLGKPVAVETSRRLAP